MWLVNRCSRGRRVWSRDGTGRRSTKHLVDTRTKRVKCGRAKRQGSVYRPEAVFREFVGVERSRIGFRPQTLWNETDPMTKRTSHRVLPPDGPGTGLESKEVRSNVQVCQGSTTETDRSNPTLGYSKWLVISYLSLFLLLPKPTD